MICPDNGLNLPLLWLECLGSGQFHSVWLSKDGAPSLRDFHRVGGQVLGDER